MFRLLGSYTWNFFEAGHGKGAADGVGAVCKRTADRCVAQGKDVADFCSFYEVLNEKCPNINIYKIFETDIKDFDNSCNPENTKTFVGTMKVHQVR